MKLAKYREDFWEHLVNEIFEGVPLTAPQISHLESRLLKDSESLEIRAQLLTYYYRLRDENARKKQEELGFWFIRNHPNAMSSFLQLLVPVLSAEHTYFVAEDIWLEHLKRAPDDRNILMNSSFFLSLFPEKQEEILLKLIEREPEESFHKLSLIEFRVKQLPLLAPNLRSKSATETYQLFAEVEPKLKSDWEEEKEEFAPPYDLAARLSFLAGDLPKAEAFARTVLSIKEWPYFEESTAQAHQGAYNLLGLIALKRGDQDQALGFLRQAGTIQFPEDTPPWLFPDCELAQALLSLGEKKAVCNFLGQYPQAMFADRQNLAATVKMIESGESVCLDKSLLASRTLAKEGLKLLEAGKRERAQERMKQASLVLYEEWSCYWALAELQAQLGEDEAAITSLEHAIQLRPRLKGYLQSAKSFEHLKSLPRFVELLN